MLLKKLSIYLQRWKTNTGDRVVIREDNEENRYNIYEEKFNILNTFE